jgi:microcystin-dependent protein
MATSFIGEIRMFGGNFAPDGWMFCQGQLLPIDQYDTLFNLIGTTYGGDGQTTFALPDLQGRLPIHQGSGYVIGQRGGVETVALNVNQIPAHSHALVASTSIAQQTVPTGQVLAQPTGEAIYRQDVPNGTNMLNPTTLTNSGGSQPHNNTQPFLCVSFIISLFGVFPSSN